MRNVDALGLVLLLSSCAPGVIQRATPSGESTGGQRAAAPVAAAAPDGLEPRTASGGSSRRLVFEGGQLELRFEPGTLALGDAALVSFVERCARAVQGYIGRFPVAHARLQVRATPGAGIHGGQALPTSPPSVLLSVGVDTSELDFERNWSLTHELVHLALPSVPRAHHWLEEGLATFAEPIARARSGWIDEREVWAEWIENMPLGLPGPGDGGLDHDSSWGSTYWGGALFWLLADVALLEQTGGRQGVEHALRAIVDAGGNLSERWPLTRVLEVADAASGTHVLRDTHRQLGPAPFEVDLQRLWHELGVRSLPDGGSPAQRIAFDDSAPRAVIRRKIVAGAH